MAIRHIFLGLLAAASLGLGTTASAGLTVVGGSEGEIPGGSVTNTVLGDGVVWDGFYGGSVDAAAGQLTFTFIGFEAGNLNSFLIGDDTIFTTTQGLGSAGKGRIDDPIGTTFTYTWGGGLLDFAFRSQRGSRDETVTNADNPDNNPLTEQDHGRGEEMDFFLSFSNTTERTGNGPLYIFFDDFGAGIDDDHDDMVVMDNWAMASSAVPAPAPLALLGFGLLGIAATRRRIL